jgi:putative membrane protein insertion efficiency factor
MTTDARLGSGEVLSWLGRMLWNLPRNLLIGVIRLWRLLISPLYGPTCKYHPSCSAYGLEAVRRHGAVRGSALTAWRILRCNPWSDGGIDDVPPARSCTPPSGEPGTSLLDHHHDPAPPARRAA